MFKHRDNIAHSPFTTDPQGSGATTMRAVNFAQDQQSSVNRGNRSTLTGAIPATAVAKKRPRDIRGIERFREVVYGEKGLPRFHAMISRNPILMYPPEGIDAARGRLQKKQEEEATNSHCQTLKENQRPMENGDEALWAMFEERKAAEELEEEVFSTEKEKTMMGKDSIEGNEAIEEIAPNPSSSTVNPPDSISPLGGKSDKELANYHHRQLDALIGLYYEFNHLTFMKLPISDTLQLLQRCGKEAVAHTLEFEMQLRMRRETRLKELENLDKEEKELKQRELEAQEMVLAMELQAAEEAHHTLECTNNDDVGDDDDVVPVLP
ncbi:uncharacterized protein TM35_000301470 [Trypanosoma theileri]|uniref:Uncharacterized protein n=1 Tax=Trypanosoma theileri TaxID=67003 RepID=A0A1X0NN31_9TRYP|nr:uncharacterized protein TM35_000301470 [Trypanosoma theileri]ORC86107.1 hypothetical protein TM35_000301470 [Trypanosoma theileri]